MLTAHCFQTLQAIFFSVMALTKLDFPFCLQNSTLFYKEWESLGDAVYCSLIFWEVTWYSYFFLSNIHWVFWIIMSHTFAEPEWQMNKSGYSTVKFVYYQLGQFAICNGN